MNEYPRTIILPVILGGILFIAGQYVASQPARQQQVVDSNREITVTGEGTVSVPPDVAKITIGVQTGNLPTAQAALNGLNDSFSNVLDAVGKVGIKKEDVKTSNFSLNPSYDYVDGRQVPRGFVASEYVVVTIKDLSKVGDVIAAATNTGANQIGGVQFTVEDDAAVRAQAEEKAITQAKENGARIAKALGANLGDVKTYNASSSDSTPVPLRESLAVGGGDASAPQVPAGTNDISVTVTVTFQLK